mmetsp:Transcript_37266/g.59832  ORF Transcript_37266/g.59832 Transcript_37266/m.59832 type:complete len:113 (-) Transcript_37266:54-392(-)
MDGNIHVRASVGPAHLASCRWRVDVTLSTSEVARVLRPNVVMCLELTDGTVRTVEVGLAEFHQLRHSVAYMLNEMEWAGEELDSAHEIGKRAQAQWEKLRGMSDELGIQAPT